MKKGIEIGGIFIGNQSDFRKLDEQHSKNTKKIVELGDLDRLPGWNGFKQLVNTSEGGKKGQQLLEKYKQQHSVKEQVQDNEEELSRPKIN